MLYQVKSHITRGFTSKFYWNFKGISIADLLFTTGIRPEISFYWATDIQKHLPLCLESNLPSKIGYFRSSDSDFAKPEDRIWIRSLKNIWSLELMEVDTSLKSTGGQRFWSSEVCGGVGSLESELRNAVDRHHLFHQTEYPSRRDFVFSNSRCAGKLVLSRILNVNYCRNHETTFQ